jgi:hypothetical protein
MVMREGHGGLSQNITGRVIGKYSADKRQGRMIRNLF